MSKNSAVEARSADIHDTAGVTIGDSVGCILNFSLLREPGSKC